MLNILRIFIIVMSSSYLAIVESIWAYTIFEFAKMFDHM